MVDSWPRALRVGRDLAGIDTAYEDEVGGDASLGVEAGRKDDSGKAVGAVTLTLADSVEDSGSQPIRYLGATFSDTAAVAGWGRLGDDVGGVGSG